MTQTTAALLDAPWLQSIWQQLSSARLADRLPHAVLLGGAAGSGQEALARHLLEVMLCDQPNAAGLACGSCRGCHLRERGVHEDLHLVLPAEDRKSLSIEQIRELSERLAYAPQRAARRVALIEPAEAMTVAASNALLKTLEEPPAAALLILVSNQPRALLPTLRSRCGQWLISTPALQQSLPWLQDQLRCSVADAHWRLALNSDAVLSALTDERVPASLELCATLHTLLSDPQASAAELIRREKPRLALLTRVLGTLLSQSVRPIREPPFGRSPIGKSQDVHLSPTPTRESGWDAVGKSDHAPRRADPMSDESLPFRAPSRPSDSSHVSPVSDPEHRGGSGATSAPDAASSPLAPVWPTEVNRVLALTALLDSSSLQRLARELWQVQRWSGTGVREDLQVLATLDHMRRCVAQLSVPGTAVASLSHPLPPPR